MTFVRKLSEPAAWICFLSQNCVYRDPKSRVIDRKRHPGLAFSKADQFTRFGRANICVKLVADFRLRKTSPFPSAREMVFLFSGLSVFTK